MLKCLSFFSILILSLMIGCAAKTHEVITCYPHYADIYWGTSPSELKKTGFSTPHSRSISEAERERWCYQVKKDGYKDSDVICREKEGYRNLDFYLVPLKTIITSKPSGATIHWGASKDQIERTTHRTPRTLTVKDHSGGASWKDGYYQIKKEGFHDSEILFLPRQAHDRHLHFHLKPVSSDRAR